MSSVAPAGDLSVVVTAPGAGRSARPGLLALRGSLEDAAAAGLDIQVVVACERADLETRAVIDRWVRELADLQVAVVRVDVDDADEGRLRDEGIAAATGAIIAWADARDLCSRAWLRRAYQAVRQVPASQADAVIAHPGHVVRFDAVPTTVWTQPDSTDVRAGELVWFNPWHPWAAMRREVADAHPYPTDRPANGYGSNDWVWNAQTHLAGVRHVAVAGTSVFSGRPSALPDAVDVDGSVLPPMADLVDRSVAVRELEQLRHPHPSDHAESAESTSSSGRLRRLAGRVGAKVSAPEPAASSVSPVSPSGLDADLLADWYAARRLQPRLPDPSSADVMSCDATGRDLRFVSDRLAYWEAVDRLGGRVDAVFVVFDPADDAVATALQAHVEVMRRHRPDAAIAVVVTGPEGGASIPVEGVVVVDLAAHGLWEPFAVKVLAALVVQTRPQTVHVIGAGAGLRLVEEFGGTIVHHTSLYVSALSPGLTSDPEHGRVALAGSSPRLLTYVHAVFADSQTLIDDLVELDGLPSALFVHADPRTGAAAPAFDAAVATTPAYLPRAHGVRRMPLHYWATPETAARLSAEPVDVALHTGSNGRSNFGDVLQNKNGIAVWQRLGRRVTVFFPRYAGSSPERVEQLRRWYPADDVVFVGEYAEAVPEGLVEFEPVAGTQHLQVVGGGYLNRFWGRDNVRLIDALADDLGVERIVFAGLQIDSTVVPALRDLGVAHDVAAFGLRDRRSLALAQRELADLNPIYTFDDLTEMMVDWTAVGTARDPQPGAADRPTRLAIHVNTSDYAGGDTALQRWSDLLQRVRDRFERLEVTVINSFSDEYPIVRDSLDSVARMAEGFGFDRFEVVNLATAALDCDFGAGLPAVAEPLRHMDLCLASSYHTALFMGLLGVPTYLVGNNDYFSWKAELFGLPPVEEFLADPTRYRLRLDDDLAARAAWMQALPDVAAGH